MNGTCQSKGSPQVCTPLQHPRIRNHYWNFKYFTHSKGLKKNTSDPDKTNLSNRYMAVDLLLVSPGE